MDWKSYETFTTDNMDWKSYDVELQLLSKRRLSYSDSDLTRTRNWSDMETITEVTEITISNFAHVLTAAVYIAR